MEKIHTPIQRMEEREQEQSTEGASAEPPQFKASAKMESMTHSPYDGKGGTERFAFGSSNQAYEQDNQS